MPGIFPALSRVRQSWATADTEAVRHRADVVEEMAILEATDEMADLAREYFETIDIPDAARADSFHLAFATWHGMDFLVTWNCKHIASAKVRRIVETINAERGIRTPEICTPEELMEI